MFFYCSREEKWSGTAAYYFWLRVCGCAAYVHLTKGKHVPRSKSVCYWVICREGTKGYRLWVRSSQGFKTITSRYVMFDENNMPCLNDKLADSNQSPKDRKVQFEVEPFDQSEYKKVPQKEAKIVPINSATSASRGTRNSARWTFTTSNLDISDFSTTQSTSKLPVG